MGGVVDVRGPLVRHEHGHHVLAVRRADVAAEVLGADVGLARPVFHEDRRTPRLAAAPEVPPGGHHDRLVAPGRLLERRGHPEVPCPPLGVLADEEPAPLLGLEREPHRRQVIDEVVFPGGEVDPHGQYPWPLSPRTAPMWVRHVSPEPM